VHPGENFLLANEFLPQLSGKKKLFCSTVFAVDAGTFSNPICFEVHFRI
jgi:hypothetical protein